MPVRDIKPINLFKQPDIENGIRINVDSVGKAINAIKEMFEKKPNIIYGISDYKITNYCEIIFAFRNWLINNTLNVPIKFVLKTLSGSFFDVSIAGSAQQSIIKSNFGRFLSLLYLTISKL